VVAEDHPFIGDEKIAAVFQALSGSGAKAVEGKNFGGDEAAVEAITQRVATGRGHDQPKGVDGFATMQSNRADGERSQRRNGTPKQKLKRLIHKNSLLVFY